MGTIIAWYRYTKAAQLFPWATRDHFIVWFTGELKRHRRTEVILLRLVRKGKLVAVRFGNKLVYSTPKNSRRIDRAYPHNIYHGLGVTEGLVRIIASDPTGTIIPASYFRGLGAVPEWGIQYNNGSLLLFEFSTYDNFYRRLKLKLKHYTEVLPKYEIIERESPEEKIDDDEVSRWEIPFLPPPPTDRPKGRVTFVDERKLRRAYIIFGAIIGILIVVIAYLLLRPPEIPLIPSTQAPEKTPTDTSVPPAAAVPPTKAPPTGTPSPTFTLSPTNIPTPTRTPQPTQAILIETNFADNNLAGWTVEGKYTILNGNITAQGREEFSISAGDASWKNYEILASYASFYPDTCVFSLGVRVKDRNNKMALSSVRAGRIGWHTIINGKSSLIAGNEALYPKSPLVLDVIVQGNKFNWVGGTSVTMDGFETGGIMITSTCNALTHIKVIKLP